MIATAFFRHRNAHLDHVIGTQLQRQIMRGWFRYSKLRGLLRRSATRLQRKLQSWGIARWTAFTIDVGDDARMLS